MHTITKCLLKCLLRDRDQPEDSNEDVRLVAILLELNHLLNVLAKKNSEYEDIEDYDPETIVDALVGVLHNTEVRTKFV